MEALDFGKPKQPPASESLRQPATFTDERGLASAIASVAGSYLRLLEEPREETRAKERDG